MDVASLTCIGVAKQLLASSLQQQYMQAPAWHMQMHLKILRTLRTTQKFPQFFTKLWSAQQIAATCACCLFPQCHSIGTACIVQAGDDKEAHLLASRQWPSGETCNQGHAHGMSGHFLPISCNFQLACMQHYF